MISVLCFESWKKSLIFGLLVFGWNETFFEWFSSTVRNANCIYMYVSVASTNFFWVKVMHDINSGGLEKIKASKLLTYCIKQNDAQCQESIAVSAFKIQIIVRKLCTILPRKRECIISSLFCQKKSFVFLDDLEVKVSMVFHTLCVGFWQQSVFFFWWMQIFWICHDFFPDDDDFPYFSICWYS